MTEGFTVDQLLSETGWIRGMAQALVADASIADDLTQETVIAALDSEPKKASSPRSWLLGILRNRARLHFRGQARRKRRETRVARTEATTVEDALEKLEMQTLLATELLQLREPYRTTITLRFYEDLEPAEIATRLSVPASTVRVRIHRGLEMLRVRLDERHNGNRKEWLALVAGLYPTEKAAAASASSALSVAALVLLSAGLIGVLWTMAPWSRTPNGPESTASRASIPAAPLEPNSDPSPILPATPLEQPELAESSEGWQRLLNEIVSPAIAPSELPLVGRVIHKGGGSVDGLIVTATPRMPWASSSDLGVQVQHQVEQYRLEKEHTVRVQTDAEGFFRIEPVLPYEYTFVVEGVAGDKFPEQAKPGEWALIYVDDERVDQLPTPIANSTIANSALPGEIEVHVSEELGPKYSVHLLRIGASSSPPARALLYSGYGQTLSGETPLRFESIPDGIYLVGLVRGSDVLAQEQVRVAGGVASVKLLDVLPDEVVVVVRVTDPAQKPVPHVTISILDGKPGQWSYSTTTSHSESGEHRLELSERARKALSEDEEVVLLVESQAFGSTWCSLDDLDSEVLAYRTLAYQPEVAVELSLSNLPTDPLAASLELQLLDETLDHPVWQGPLGPQLSLSAQTGRYLWQVVFQSECSEDVVLTGGELVAEGATALSMLSLPTLHRLKIETDPDQRLTFVDPVDGTDRFISEDLYEVLLPSGRYKVRVGLGPHQRDIEFSVPATTELDLREEAN